MYHKMRSLVHESEIYIGPSYAPQKLMRLPGKGKRLPDNSDLPIVRQPLIFLLCQKLINPIH